MQHEQSFIKIHKKIEFYSRLIISCNGTKEYLNIAYVGITLLMCVLYA